MTSKHSELGSDNNFAEPGNLDPLAAETLRLGTAALAGVRADMHSQEPGTVTANICADSLPVADTTALDTKSPPHWPDYPYHGNMCAPN